MERDEFDPSKILEDYNNKRRGGLQDESLLRQLPFMMNACEDYYEHSNQLFKTGKHTAGALKNVLAEMKGLRLQLEGHIQAINPDTDAQLDQEALDGVLAKIFTKLVHLERSIYTAMRGQSSNQWRDFYRSLEIEKGVENYRG